MATLLPVYQAYYILAGIAGLALYPWVARACFQRFQEYIVSTDKASGLQGLFVSALIILACSIEVQFCFARAAALIRMAAA